MNGKAILLDSSVWIEILGVGPLAELAEKELRASTIVVPTVVLFEVYKKISIAVSEEQGLSVVALLSQYTVVDLTHEVSLTAADLSRQYKLGMADSFVLAHSHHADAPLVTLDNDFSRVPGVKVIRKS